MPDRLIRFQLFGQEFTFSSDAPEEEVESIIVLLRQELGADEKLSRSAVPSSKMLVLGCLRMAAKLVQLQGEYQEYRQSQQRLIEHLISKVTDGLD